MAGRYLEDHLTPAVLKAQERYYGRARRPSPQPERDSLTSEELEFIARRDSFYLATVTSTGWPYIQHRGGPPGFLRPIAPNVLAFADYRGNLRLVSAGNVEENDRVALFLMDYPNRERLKLMGRAQVLDARDYPQLVSQVSTPGEVKNVERIFRIEVISYDWNCSQYITPRFTAEEVREAVEAATRPLKERLAQLEAERAS